MTHIGTAPGYRSDQARAERRHAVLDDLIAYFVVNAFLVGVWAVTGFGYFWPAWVMGGWAVFLAVTAWDAYWRREEAEDDAERRMRKQG